MELPQDIHPLPDSVTPYVRPFPARFKKSNSNFIPYDYRSILQFVYPFTLEPHIITLESSRRSTIAAHSARREAYLRSRAEEIERRKRDALHKIAPGLGTVLVPVRAPSTQGAHENSGGSSSTGTQAQRGPDIERNVMDDLVDQLEALESRTAGRGDAS